jgi:hypothetical protein
MITYKTNFLMIVSHCLTYGPSKNQACSRIRYLLTAVLYSLLFGCRYLATNVYVTVVCINSLINRDVFSRQSAFPKIKYFASGNKIIVINFLRLFSVAVERNSQLERFAR